MRIDGESWQVLGRYWLLLPALAGLVCIGLLLSLRPLLARYALARPNARSSHHVPTPQGGGIAVIAATIGAILMIAVAYRDFDLLSNLAIVFAAAVFLAVVGAIDDIRTIAVAPRLLVQALAVGAVIAALPPEIRMAPALPLLLERALLLVAGLWFVNLVNFMDGLDWMTVAEVIPITAGLIIIGALGALPPHGLLVALALGGATIGFAPFNRPVARLFLGDVGSLPIGLLLGWLLMLLAAQDHAAAALLLPLYYLADTTITLGRRVAKGEAFWHAHRTHFYQQAIDRGLTVMQVVSRVFAANIILAALAIATVTMQSSTADIGALAAGAAIVALLLWSLVRHRTG